MMAGRQTAAFQHFASRLQDLAPQVHLIEPTPGRMRQAVAFTNRQMPLRRIDPLKRHGRIAIVGGRNPPFNQVIGGVDAVVQREPQGIGGVAQVNAELRGVTLVQLVRVVAKYRATHAVRERHLDTGIDKLHVLVAGIFFRRTLRRIVKRGPTRRTGRRRIIVNLG